MQAALQHSGTRAMSDPDPGSAQSPASGWRGSYRARYALLALGIGLVLLVAGLSGRIYLARATEQQLAALRSWTQRSNALVGASMALSALQARLQDFLLDPRRGTRAQHLIQGGHDLDQAMRTLTADAAPNEATAALLRRLNAACRTLTDLIPELIRIRSDVRHWLPASGLMQARMIPANEAMSALFDGLRAQLPDTAPKSREYLARLRYTWLRLISEFRLYVANRFGIFSDPQAAMKARSHDIEIFAEAFGKDLRRLQEALTEEAPGILEFSGLEAMDRHFHAWSAAYRDVRLDLDSPRWRRDVYLIRSDIAPTLQELRGTLETLRQVLDGEALANHRMMEDTAHDLSLFFLALVGFMMAVMAGGYFLFRHWLLTPIAHTTRALRRVAQGLPVDLEHQGRIEETRDLLDAFQELRRQVTERERRLEHLAHHDHLTRLPNRALFEDRLLHALSRSQRGTHELLGLIFLDLDGFKEINDRLGHQAGDALLYQVAERLRGFCRASDTVARLSGDEFALLLEDLPSRDRAARVAGKVVGLFQAPFDLPSCGPQRVRASIGIALAPVDGVTPRQLIRHADTAMYQAKRSGRNGYCFFSPELNREAEARQALARSLRETLDRGGLEVRFQAVESLSSGSWAGSRARLFRPSADGGAEISERWLPQVGAPDLLATLMDFLLEQLARTLQADGNGEGSPWVCFKLPPVLLRDDTFMQGLRDRLDEGRIPADRLFLEIDEASLQVDEGRFLHRLLECKARGLRIALDGFGNRGSSLPLLRKLEIDLFILAPALIADSVTDPEAARITATMIRLAHALGGRAAALEVNTEGQLGCFRQRGGDLAAGEAIAPYTQVFPFPQGLALRA